MKRFLMILALSTGALAPAYAPGQEARPVEVAAEKPDPTEEFVELVDGDVRIGDVVYDTVQVYDAIHAYRDGKDKSTKVGLLMLLLAVAFKLVISTVKLIAKDFFSNQKGKTAIRLGTMALGLAVLVLSRVGGGMGWIDAAFLSLSGPGSIVVHELLKLFKDD